MLFVTANNRPTNTFALAQSHQRPSPQTALYMALRGGILYSEVTE